MLCGKRIENIRKKITLWGLCFILLLFHAQGFAVHAADISDDPQFSTSMSNQEKEPKSYGISLFRSGVNPYTSLTYTHSGQNADKDIIYGIDVSSHNGTINWQAVKQAGIQFAVIRVGYRGYGAGGTLNEDTNFRANLAGAANAGLKVGVYIFSQAITDQEAAEEAQFLLNRIQGYKIDLPVVIDYEYASTGSGATGRLYQANLNSYQHTSICNSFCRQIISQGYTPMVYANKTMLEQHLNANVLENNYKIWLANYTTSTSYQGSYDMWQYSSSGRINGINGNVDCNFWYEKASASYQGIDYSAVYDYEYYTSAYPDIKNAYGGDKAHALEHFVLHGMAEGRRGNKQFNVYTYRNRYADLRAIYQKNWKSYYLHYINSGKQEGRTGEGTSELLDPLTVYNGVDYSAVYDFNYYISHYTDIKKAYEDNDYAALQHFVTAGMSEGRQGNSSFYVRTYANRYADLRSIYKNNYKNYFLHYLNYGKGEGRSGSGTSELMNPLTVYNGIDYSAVYDFTYYTNRYTDIKNGYGLDEYAVLQHFVNAGMKEGRQGSSEFCVQTYKNRYSDLNRVYGNDWKSYYIHYINYGKREGRRGI